MTPGDVVKILWKIQYYVRMLFCECKEWGQGESLPRSELNYFVAIIHKRARIEHVFHFPEEKLLVNTTKKERQAGEMATPIKRKRRSPSATIRGTGAKGIQ